MTELLSLSASAQGVLNLIGHGYKLRVPRDDQSKATLEVSPEWISRGIKPSVELTDQQRRLNSLAVQELISSPLVHKLTADGEPPPAKRKKNQGWKLGWKEMGFTDGDVADYYVCTQ